MPATSQLDWLISMTAMIVLFWSRATRDLLRSFGWGIAALHRLDAATKLPSLAARPIASIGPPGKRSVLRVALIDRRPLLQCCSAGILRLVRGRDRWFDAGS